LAGIVTKWTDAPLSISGGQGSQLSAQPLPLQPFIPIFVDDAFSNNPSTKKDTRDSELSISDARKPGKAVGS